MCQCADVFRNLPEMFTKSFVFLVPGLLYVTPFSDAKSPTGPIVGRFVRCPETDVNVPDHLSSISTRFVASSKISAGLWLEKELCVD